MENNQFVYCVGMAICLFCSYAAADHPTITFGLDGAGSINTISANTLPSGVFIVGMQTEVIDNDEFNTKQLENFASSGLEGVHSIDQIINTSISFSYGITENLSINARLPYTERKNIREGEIEEGEPEAHTHGDSSGLGDLLFLGQYRIVNSDSTDISVNFGIKLPTGETNDKNNDGIRFETEFQPGSGSVDFLLGAAMSRWSGSFGYHANILYNKTTEGSQSTEIGDAFLYNAAITYRINGKDHAAHHHKHNTKTHWDFMLELNGEKRSKNKIIGNSEKNSGGNTLFLSPGVRVSSGKLGGFLALGIPVIENQNGKQTDFNARISAGISFAF